MQFSQRFAYAGLTTYLPFNSEWQVRHLRWVTGHVLVCLCNKDDYFPFMAYELAGMPFSKVISECHGAAE